MSLARRVDPGTAMHGVLSKEAQRVRRNVDRLFERCRRANSVAEFMACIDDSPPPVRDAARTMVLCIDDSPPPVRDAARTLVLSMLNSMGLSYSTWEEAKRDARNIPYYYLAMQFARS